MRGGAISGRVFDEFGDPLASVNVVALRAQMSPQGQRLVRTGTSVPSDDTGAYRVYGLPPGNYFVSVNERAVQAAGPISTTEGPVTFAPTYYPGTTAIAEAQRIALGPGEEQAGITMSMLPVRAARISGTVVNSADMPVAATLALSRGLTDWMPPIGGGNGSGPDGSFTVNNVPPGNYTLNVVGRVTGSAPPEVASVPVSVNGADIVGLTVMTGSGARVQGTITVDNGGRVNTSMMRVTGQPLQGGPAMWTPRAQVTPAGTFELEGMIGPYTLRLDGLPQGYAVKSVTANGADVSDVAIDFRATDSVAMRVLLTDRIAQVGGTVRSDRPVRGTTVLLFPDDTSKWTGTSRFVRTARVGEDGTFSVRGLPPHSRYLAIALEYLDAGEQQTPEFLEGAKKRAVSFSLGEGEQKTLELPLSIR